MIVLAYLGSQCKKIHTAGWKCWFLRPFSWSRASVLTRWIRQKNSIKFCANLGKVRRRPWQWLDNRSGKKAWAIHGKSKPTETEKGKTGEEKSQEHAHHFLWHQGDCSQRIHPHRPNSQFRILLWRFTAIAWKCAKTSPRTLATKRLAVAWRQRTVSHFLFHQGIF
jgi:hypothetical protein